MGWWNSDVCCLVVETRVGLVSSASLVPCVSLELAESVASVSSLLLRSGSWHSTI